MLTIRTFLCSLALSVFIVPANAEDSGPKINDGHNLLQDDGRQVQLTTGSAVGTLAFKDLSGNSIYLQDSLERGPAVIVFMSTQCPLAKRYTARLNRLHESYADRGVSVFAVFPNSDETDESIAAFAKQVNYPFALVRDVNGYITARLGATMTPQAFLIDQDSVLRYRGSIDDNRYEDRVKEHHLVAALDAVLTKQELAVSTTKAVGCSIHQTQGDAAGKTTYTGHIARILQDNCQSCHRPDQVAPFSLTNYEEASRWRTEIQAYTHERLMPPWKATPGFGDFKNDISLSNEEIELIAAWVEQGAPQGNPKEMPPAPRFNDGWAFGEPDLIVEMPEEYVVGPEGEDDYRHFVIPSEFAKDRFVETIDVRPGNRGVVHHVIAYVDTSGKARKLDAADPGPGYTRFGGTGFDPASVIGGWAPGNTPVKTPPASGHWLPAKCDIVLQVHYYRTGVEERDRTKIGVYFSKKDRPVPVRPTMAINTKFVVPAGKKLHTVHAQRTIKQSSYLFSVTPHMHLIGETMKVTAHLPDGTVIPVVQIDDWDFNWQTTYHFRKLQHLPAGTKVKLVATFDNSAENPNNPNNPPKDMRWGERTTDEMCIAFVDLLKESEYDPSTQNRRVEPKKLVKAD
jgi:mono/diheme cytochrome c family protein